MLYTPSHVQKVITASKGKRLMRSWVARCGGCVLCPSYCLVVQREAGGNDCHLYGQLIQEDPVHQVPRAPRSQPRKPVSVPELQSSQQAIVALLLI